MSQVIARRYRPQGFDEVIGQQPIIQTLHNAIASGRVAHGFIFSGHRGIGKTTVARILAKALNCQAGAGPTPTPCGTCDSCREIRDGSAVDVIEIDAASNRGIDEIRALRERVRYRPARDRYKFFILDEAHQLTDDAFNALLKTLEEPPEWAVFVLATTEPEALPATIRSRCQHFAFRAVAFSVILEHLRRIAASEGIAAEDEALGLIAEAGEGSVRDALSLLDQAMSYGAGASGISAEAVRSLLGRVSSAEIKSLLEAVASDSTRATLEHAHALLGTGVGEAQLCRQLTQTIRNAIVARSAGAESELLELTEAERATAAAVGAWFREEELTRFLQALLRAASDLRHGQQQRLHIELALMKMLHARRLAAVEDVLASLRGEAPPPLLPRPAAAPVPVRPLEARPLSPPSPAPVLKRGIPEVAAHPAPPPPPTPLPAEAGSETRAVFQELENRKMSSLVTILSRAQWQWDGPAKLELVFAGSSASQASLADQPAMRKSLAAACVAAIGRAPEVTIVARPESNSAPAAPPPPALPGSAEERAGNHPLLQKLRQQIPTHVLRTRPIPS